MVPDKFNMVDMGGIDLFESQGVAITGLYQRLVESIALCRYQCLYNWSFNGILISPSYVEMEVREDGVWINEGVMIDEEDVIHVYTEGGDPPVIEGIEITSNGVYTAGSGVDGYSPVTVNVQSAQPVIEGIEITSNGVYTAGSGVDGYSPVTVSVPSAQPVIESIEITSNGVYTAGSGVDGYSPITVNVSGGIPLLQSGAQISTTSNYATYTFGTQMSFESYDAILVVLLENNSIVASGSLVYTSGSAVFHCYGDLDYSMQISDTSISCTRYSGVYRNLFANIYGINF